MINAYLLSLAGLAIIGCILVSQQQKGTRIRFRFGFSTRSIGQGIVRALRDDRYEEVFKKAGLHLAIAHYTAARNLLAIILLCGLAGTIIRDGVDGALLPLLLIAALYMLSEPRETRGKTAKRTYFKMLLDKFRESYLNKKDDELMTIVTQFKNLIVTQAQFDQTRSAESIIETLLHFTTDLTRPIFAQTLSLIRLSKSEEAARQFGQNFGTKIGEEFATILHKLDELDPTEFLEQINSFQDGLREEKRTRRQKKQEQAGRLIFLLASCVVSIILFDYMYIMFNYLMKILTF